VRSPNVWKYGHNSGVCNIAWIGDIPCVATAPGEQKKMDERKKAGGAPGFVDQNLGCLAFVEVEVTALATRKAALAG